MLRNLHKTLIFFLLGFSLTSYSQKLKSFEDSVKYDTKMLHFEELFVQANLEKNKHNYEQALTMYYDCLKLKPTSAAVYYEMAQICASQSNYSEAEANAQKAIKYSPENVEYKRFLDDLYIKMGKKK